MKVAISLPDPVFRAAKTLARRFRKARSELYAEAIDKALLTHRIRQLAPSTMARVDYGVRLVLDL